MARDLQGATPVPGKGEVEAGDLESMITVLPPNRRVLGLPEGWPHLKGGDGGARRGNQARAAEEE